MAQGSLRRVVAGRPRCHDRDAPGPGCREVQARHVGDAPDEEDRRRRAEEGLRGTIARDHGRFGHRVSLRGAELVVSALAAGGVRHLFSLSGNQILSIYDATIGRNVRIIHTRHEASAVHMADAWGRLSEEPGVALVTAGPGHLNAVSALYGALMAESPVVLLSGHAPASHAGRGAFQEIDQAGVATAVTKASWVAKDTARLRDDIARALALARSGR